MPNLSKRTLPLIIAGLVVASPAAAIPISLHATSATAPQSYLRTVAYSQTVLSAQQLLNQRGYDAGTEDGLMGAKTRGAIMTYQRDNGLTVTGQASADLLRHIQGNSRTAAQASARGSAKADPAIKRLQRRLERLGYNTEVTGQLDRQTQAAIRQYQRDNDIFVTGTASEYVQGHIRDSAQAQRKQRQAERKADKASESKLSTATIVDIQKGLRARGYRIDSLNGRVDAQTRDAIQEYQRDSGTRVDGEASIDLAEALQDGFDAYEPTREDIQQVQQRLNRLGYSAGPADGVMGPSTRKAVRDYRSSKDLTVNADVDLQLLNSLNIRSSSSATAQASSSGTSNDNRYALRISDDFSDGNYRNDPSWQVVAGNFNIRDGELVSQIDTQRPESSQDLGKSVLQGVLGEVLGVQATGQNSSAAIVQATDFNSAFQISTRVLGNALGSARFGIGPYRGTNVSHGYRLVYDSERSSPLALIVLSDNGNRTIMSARSGTNLADGRWHDVVWTRDQRGQMTIEVDGQVEIEVLDQSLGGMNDGLSLVNLGGLWRVDDVSVATLDR